MSDGPSPPRGGPDRDSSLYMLGRIAQGQQDLGRDLNLLRREVKEFHLAAERRIDAVDRGFRSLKARFEARILSCDERLSRSARLRHPWYAAAAAAAVAAVSGLLGALASLVFKGGPR
ncbi:MAG: hypothetical protein JW909_06275 [Planctomycetes bacterium]|nr:hypothetical protein [Planctomycetota bacterium]